MPFVRRRVAVYLAVILLTTVLILAACQVQSIPPAPADLPTLPPPTGLAALVTATSPSTATATVQSSDTPTATASPVPTQAATATPESTATVSGTPATPGPTATPCFGSINGQVVADLNANRQADAGEPGVMGATLFLKNAKGLVALYTTGSGQFGFPGLVAGPYTLTESLPADFTAENTLSFDLTVACGQTVTQTILNLSTTAPTPTPAPAATSAPFTSAPPDPRSNATGFTPFSAGPVYHLGACGSISSPGTYLLDTSLVSQWDCLQIYSDNVILDCQHNSLNGVDRNGYGVVVHHTSPVLGRAVRNIEIRNCSMSLHRYGIFVDAADNLSIHDNSASNSYTDVDGRGYGAFLGLTEGGGIRVGDTRGALVSGNHTDTGAIGIDVRQSTGIIVRGNSANANSAWGIHLYGVTNSEVSGNTSTNNIRYCTWGSGVVGAGCDAGGIMLQAGSSSNVVKNNTIAGQNGNGIFIKAHGTPCGDSNIVANNRIVGALYNGIEMSFCKNNKLQGNEISNSLDGIWMGFATNSEIDAGNYLHDMTNHGIISWNSQYNNISTNRIVNSREGLYFYSSDYSEKDFYFVPGTPADHMSTANCLCSNMVANNAEVAVHFNNSYKNQVTGNTLIANALNFKMEGSSGGNIIENNSIQGGAFVPPPARQAAFAPARSPALAAYDSSGLPLSPSRLLQALTRTDPGESFSLRWFKYKLRASLGLPQTTPVLLQDLAGWLLHAAL
ncbi:MAG: NosD domain-containing protein [Rudaea sp.]